MIESAKRRAHGFVAWSEPPTPGHLFDHLELDLPNGKGICWQARHRRDGATIGDALRFVRSHKPPGTDAWEILLALFPEDREYLEAFMKWAIIWNLTGPEVGDLCE